MIKTGEQMHSFLSEVERRGFTPYLVGGAVIDNLVGRSIKDWDIEIFGCSLDDIKTIVASLGLTANLVGAEFGIVVTKMDGISIDLAVPRRENKTGKGYKGFETFFDPDMTLYDASLRRDLTINAMMVNMLTEELVDIHGGMQDLETGCIRAVNHGTFSEDPSRVLRIMQLLPRKGKFVDEATLVLCRGLVDTFNEIQADSVRGQFEKLLLKAAKPSMGLEFLRASGWIKHFPELENLIGCEQNAVHHPEGDVWNHTMMVVDRAAEIRDCIADDNMKLAFMFAALLHDVGKPSTTRPDLTAHGHAKAGTPLAQRFMKRLNPSTQLVDRVMKLVEIHMQPHALLHDNASNPAWHRLHRKFQLDVLLMLAIADGAGRTGHTLEEAIDHVTPAFTVLNGLRKFGAKPLVTGFDLLKRGHKQGEGMGKLLKELFDRQLNGETREELLASI